MSKALFMAAAAGGSVAPTYVDDVFSTWLYTGNGSTQTITNGIDLAGQGGMVWTKCRDIGYSHQVMDTERGVASVISTDLTSGFTGATDGITSFSSSGYSIGARGQYNEAPGTFVSWTFRKAPKFFDVVTWTGNATNRTIAHSLGVVPGCIMVKRTDTTGDWQVYHRSTNPAFYTVLNTNAVAVSGATRWNSTPATSSVFSLGTATEVNASGGTYVAYVFAHDAATDGLIQCGTFATDGSGLASVTLGWEPQFVIYKSGTAAVSDWFTFDSLRGMPVGSADAILAANSSAAETSVDRITPEATGFSANTGSITTDYIYIAIRRSNRPPTLGSEVFSVSTRIGTGSATEAPTSVTPDMVMVSNRASNASKFVTADRLRGQPYLVTNSTNGTNAEATTAAFIPASPFDSMTSFGVGTNAAVNSSGPSYVDFAFKRAATFFDEVCYTGTGSAMTVAHNLGVAPELMIVKYRSSTGTWYVYSVTISIGTALALNAVNAPFADPDAWNSTSPTSSVFTIGKNPNVNTNGGTYVAYLFATAAGVSKVGTYTGNGSNQTINCGFTTGARFVLIKRTDSTGDWFVWDTARGIVSGNDPHLSLNTTAAEVTTDDSIDPATSGFIVNQLSATNINVNAATYIYLAIA